MRFAVLIVLVVLVTSVFADYGNNGKWNILGISSITNSIKGGGLSYNLAEEAVTKKPIDIFTFKLETSTQKALSGVALDRLSTTVCNFKTPFITVTSQNSQAVFKTKGLGSNGDSNKFYFLINGGVCNDGSKLEKGTILMGESVSGNRFAVNTNKEVWFRDDTLKFSIEESNLKKLTGVRLTKVKQSDSCDLKTPYVTVASSKPPGVFEVKGPLSKGSSNKFYLSIKSATCDSRGKLSSGRIIMPDSVDPNKYVVGITIQASVFN